MQASSSTSPTSASATNTSRPRATSNVSFTSSTSHAVPSSIKTPMTITPGLSAHRLSRANSGGAHSGVNGKGLHRPWQLLAVVVDAADADADRGRERERAPLGSIGKGHAGKRSPYPVMGRKNERV